MWISKYPFLLVVCSVRFSTQLELLLIFTTFSRQKREKEWMGMLKNEQQWRVWNLFLVGTQQQRNFYDLRTKNVEKRAMTMANEGEGFYVCLVILWHSHCCYFLHSLCLHSLSFLLSTTKSKDSLEWTRVADFQLFTVESARNEQLLFLLACFSSHECRAHIINLVFVSNSRPREKIPTTIILNKGDHVQSSMWNMSMTTACPLIDPPSYCRCSTTVTLFQLNLLDCALSACVSLSRDIYYGPFIYLSHGGNLYRKFRHF